MSNTAENFEKKGKHLKIPFTEETDKLPKLKIPPREERERSLRNYEETVRTIENEAIFRVQGRSYSIFILELEKDVYPSTLKDIIKNLHVEIILFLSPSQILVKCDKESLDELTMRIKSKKLPDLISKNIIRIRKMDASEKISDKLNEIMMTEKKPETLDVLLLFMPKFTVEEFNELLKNLRSEESIKNIISKEYVKETWIVATATVMIDLIKSIADKTFIYQISEQLQIQGEEISNPHDSIDIERKINQNLPNACLIDTGVNKELFNSYLLGSDSESNLTTWIDPEGHGTMVGSLLVWHESLFKGNGKLTPRCNIYSYKINPKSNFHQSILNGIQKFRSKTRIFNLSANYINRNKLFSYLTNELDIFIQEQNVILVNSVGNIAEGIIIVGLDKWGYPEYLERNVCFNPSDSKNIFSVGAFAYEDSDQSLALKNQISPYCPKGKDIKIADKRIKPDIFVKGGNLERNGNRILLKKELSVPVIDHNGRVTYNVGTSLASPIVASYLAELAYLYPEIENVETLKAILLSNSKIEEDNGTYRLKLENISTLFDSNNDLTFFSEGVLPVGKEYDCDLEKYLQISHRIRFFVPQEAYQMKIFLNHSDNFQLGNFENLYTYLKISVTKHGRAGKLNKNEFDTYFLNVDSPIQFFIKNLKRGYSTFWEIKIHAQSSNLPRNIEKNLQVRYGIAIKILLDQSKWFLNEKIRKNVVTELKPYINQQSAVHYL